MKHTPGWIDKKIDIRKTNSIKSIIKDLKLNTVCTQALCPNISDCYSKSQATFLILGKVCTRNCSFCNITKKTPSIPDPSEPERIVLAAEQLGLKHVIITSPTRDDLPDGGAGLFAKTVSLLKQYDRSITTEILVPDFQGNFDAVQTITYAKPDIISHNLETVNRIYKIRNGADYNRSLDLLKQVKTNDSSIITKSGIMLGLGEKESEVIHLLADLIKINCRYLSIGQYLAPTKKHYPVVEYINPAKFDEYKNEALKMGFIHVESGPYVRSSYNGQAYIPNLTLPSL